MPDRASPLKTLLIFTLFGALASLSISFGLVGLIAAFGTLLAISLLMRSVAALAGGLIAWGMTWLVLIGRTYTDCLSRYPDCDPDGVVPFLVAAGGMVLASLALGVITALRARNDPRRDD